MLLLDNDAVAAEADMAEFIEAIEAVYLELAAGGAATRTRSTLTARHERSTKYTLATMDGISRAAGVAAIRLRSDRSTEAAGRRTKFAGSEGNFLGLIVLFDLADAVPLAIIHDGIIQQMRVAATAAVAARRLARRTPTRLGVLGTGGQARAHVDAYLSVFPTIETVVIHSPRHQAREAFAAEMSERHRREFTAADEPRRVFAGSDVVAICTNATRPVFEAVWVEAGTHVSSVRHWAEVGVDFLERSDRTVVHQPPDNVDIVLADRTGRRDERPATPTPDGPTLVQLLAGEAQGRGGDDEVTYFLNNVGTGVQFAACASIVYRRCVAAGRGRELPTEWFLQQISD
ncbi:MAG TPA: hypothetical protein VMS74_00320 [Acidimicrobiia bacterium]|nr:hypothetical protein [Acidimicrobiia bacterium]